MSCDCPSLPSSCQECFENCQYYFSPLNIQKNGCVFKVPGTCVIYTGLDLPESGIVYGDDFDTVTKKLVAYINSLS